MEYDWLQSACMSENINLVMSVSVRSFISEGNIILLNNAATQSEQTITTHFYPEQVSRLKRISTF